MAPIVRNGADGERELVMARSGMPGPSQFGGAPITNIRNVSSPHWRGWLGKQNRCIVPATSFCEYADAKSRARRRNGSRSAKTVPCSPSLVYGRRGAACEGRRARQWMASMSCLVFLTTEPNAVVAPIHPKAMPVILTTPAEVDLWLLADAPRLSNCQRPLPDDALRIVASGEKEDGARQDAALRPGSRANAPALTRWDGFSLNETASGHCLEPAACRSRLAVRRPSRPS